MSPATSFARPRFVWSDSLSCEWSTWQALSGSTIGLFMKPGSCCDMIETIRLATAMMPGVVEIRTFSGSKLDSVFKLKNGEWVLFAQAKDSFGRR